MPDPKNHISLLLKELENEFGELVTCGAPVDRLRTVSALIYRLRLLKSQDAELPEAIREHPEIIRLSRNIGG